MTDTAIEIANVTVRYGRVTAVRDLTLTVPRGSVYALLGRNGAGKSSLVRCLLGQRQADAGTIRAFGEDVWTQRATLMQRIGVVSEEADAPQEMTTAQIARFCAKLYARWDQNEVDERLRRFEVPATTRFGALSKGQKKQALLALALAMSPDLLVLDDPTLGLDVVARKSLFEEVIAELADRGITVLLTTHDLAGIEALADRVAIMKNGTLVVEEELDALKARFRRIRFAAEPASVSETYPLSLEDIFISLTGEGAQR